MLVVQYMVIQYAILAWHSVVSSGSAIRGSLIYHMVVSEWAKDC